MKRVPTAVALATLLLAPAASHAADEPGPESVPGHVLIVGGAAAVPDTIGDPVASCAGSLDRAEGPDRFSTAAAMSEASDAEGPAFLASGRDFPDALASVPAIAAEDGVMLLTEPATLPKVTRDELLRRQPPSVVILGGLSAVSQEVADEVASLGFDVERVGGATRYDTAAELARAFTLPTSPVMIASGRGFADALSVGTPAARDAAPILLVAGDELPEATSSELGDRDPSSIVVVGGAAIISDAAVDAIEEVTGVQPIRIAGADRYETAAAVSATLWPQAHGSAILATGRGFADGLAAGASRTAPLLLTASDLGVSTAEELVRHTALECSVVQVGVDPVEGLTLGPAVRGPVELSISLEEGLVLLTSAADTGALLRQPDAPAADATLSYPDPTVEITPAVNWTQALASDATQLVARQPWRDERPDVPAGLTVAWQYTADSVQYREEVEAAPGLTVTAPFRYRLTTSGTLEGTADPAFIADMHARGIEVWPTIHSCGATCVEAALRDPGRRSAHAQAIASDAIASGADGINIDIEGFRDSERDAVTAFVEELSDLVQPHGLVTSFDFTVMTDTWHTPPPGFEYWSTAPDRRAISAAVDYVVLMAYDEFNRHRPAGPVASPRWVEEALRYQLRYSDPDHVLLGVPLYGRVWSGTTPRAVGIGQTEEYVREGTSTPDPRFGVDLVTLPDGRYTWAETVAGLQHRVDLVSEYGLAGTASWRLGFDTPSVWPVLAGGG